MKRAKAKKRDNDILLRPIDGELEVKGPYAQTRKDQAWLYVDERGVKAHVQVNFAGMMTHSIIKARFPRGYRLSLRKPLRKRGKRSGK